MMKLRALVATAAGLALLLVPATAAAAVCGDNGGPATLTDSGGNTFDFTDATTFPSPAYFATLYGGTPDSWDEWGTLFVGGTSEADAYSSPDNNSCSNEDGGRQHVYPLVSVNGLNVQRKIFVSGSGLPGARIL